MCVTGVVIQALFESNKDQFNFEGIDSIKKNQTQEGYWNSYWWNDNLYATANCMKALEYQKSTDNRTKVFLSKARDWILSKQLMDGGWSEDEAGRSMPFSTALALKGLLIEPDNISENIATGISWILKHQSEDGSWNSSYKLRIPHPSTTEPWNQTIWKVGGKAINAIIEDHRRIFTTATVFKTLVDYQQFLRGNLQIGK